MNDILLKKLTKLTDVFDRNAEFFEMKDNSNSTERFRSLHVHLGDRKEENQIDMIERNISRDLVKPLLKCGFTKAAN